MAISFDGSTVRQFDGTAERPYRRTPADPASRQIAELPACKFAMLTSVP
jgi:hypothetical protein